MEIKECISGKDAERAALDGGGIAVVELGGVQDTFHVYISPVFAPLIKESGDDWLDERDGLYFKRLEDKDKDRVLVYLAFGTSQQIAERLYGVINHLN